jgi:hypothetical protein
MNAVENQFSLNRANSRKQFPICVYSHHEHAPRDISRCETACGYFELSKEIPEG